MHTVQPLSASRKGAWLSRHTLRHYSTMPSYAAARIAAMQVQADGTVVHCIDTAHCLWRLDLAAGTACMLQPGRKAVAAARLPPAVTNTQAVFGSNFGIRTTASTVEPYLSTGIPFIDRASRVAGGDAAESTAHCLAQLAHCVAVCAGMWLLHFQGCDSCCMII